jgi:2-polyprenyl-3-methyl-5-hydroxy-6-metoxy-1,4-benzoquinol methylase
LKESEIRPRELFDQYLNLAAADVRQYFRDRRSFTRIVCPACGADRPQPGLEKLGFAYVVCRDCSSLYNSPRPKPELLDAFYRDAASVRFWRTNFYRETADARREKMFRPRAALVAGIVREAPSSGPTTLADIGSGYGIFLEEVRALGDFGRIVGIEPGPELAEVCRGRGFEVLVKPLENLDQGELEVDMATCFEVLEHVHDPLRFLGAARRILKPGGRLLLTTLTVSGFDIQVLWDRSKSVHPPHHLNLMSVEGIERLFDRAGFQVLELTTPGELDVDIVANARQDDPDLRLPRFVDHLLDKRGPDTRADLQRFLVANRLSSHIRVLARNPA